MKAITILDNEPYLRQISSIVSSNDTNLLNNISLLEEFCVKNEVMAMAAIQLGIPKRIIYLKNTNIDIINKKQTNEANEEENNYNESRILINPVILSREGLTEYWEACASCLDNIGLVQRPYKIKIEYYDINFNKKIDIFKGFESTVLSHEIDHLDGILHIDIAKELYLMPVEERKIFRQTHNYNILAKTGKYENLINNNKKYVISK
ncbi:MAG: peptide deformylase [Bacilli bacterium]|nr:peptide deformylase [Bacilli bacterium]